MDNIVFNQSIMGFNRTEVLNYIDTLVKQIKDQENEYTKRELELQEQMSALSNEYAEDKQKLSVADAKIRSLNFEVETQKRNVIELEDKIQLYKQSLKKKDDEILEYKKNTFSLKTRCELLSAENESWKKRQDKIGECLIESNVKAEEIIKEAEIQAEETKNDMQKKVANLAGDVVNLKSEISHVEKEIEESFAKLKNVLQTIDSSAKTIENSVVEYKIKVETLGENIRREKEILNESKNVCEEPVCEVKEVIKTHKKSLTDSVLDTISKLLDK